MVGIEAVLELARDGFVGREHEFLDELMRFVVLDPLEAERAPVFRRRPLSPPGKSRSSEPWAKRRRRRNEASSQAVCRRSRQFVVRRRLQDGEGFLVSEPLRALDQGARETRALRTRRLSQSG